MREEDVIKIVKILARAILSVSEVLEQMAGGDWNA